MSDYNLSLLCAALGQVELLQAEVQRLRDAIGQMNNVSLHQTNRILSSLGKAPPHDDPMWNLFPDGRIPVHPLTCGNDSRHTILFPFWTGDRVILRCPDCSYEQVYLPV